MTTALSFVNRVQRLLCMRASVGCQLYLVKMFVSVSIAAGFQLILSWAIMMVKDCCSLVDL